MIYNKNYHLFKIVTCGIVLTEEDLQRLTEHGLLNDKYRIILTRIQASRIVHKQIIINSAPFTL